MVESLNPDTAPRDSRQQSDAEDTCSAGAGEWGGNPRKNGPASASQGPLAWRNWQAERQGQPARTSSRTHSVLFQPLWQEFGLYSDAPCISELEFGPYRLLQAFAARRPSLGRARLTLVLRERSHLLDPSDEPMNLNEQNVSDYAGGDVGDQIASLLALALGRRMRSGGVMRLGYESDPEGKPFFGNHQLPSLGAPRNRLLLPSIGDETRLEDANPYLQIFATAHAADAVALQRAAHQYADALWWADADPRIAWIKLFGALEAAAHRWDIGSHPDPERQLRRRHRGLYERLERRSPDTIPIVAKSLSKVIGAESKMIDFVLAHAPKRPEVRPAFGSLDWDQLENVLSVLYAHRSSDLHGGIPFPEPLCQPPNADEDGVPSEAFEALGAESGGASWPAHQLPMYLHTFAYITGGALRNWWRTIGQATTPSAAQTDRSAIDSPDGEETRVK